MKTLLSFIVLISLFFAGCASKEVFEPQEVKDDWEHYGDTDFTIENIAPKIALVEDNKVMIKGKEVDITIPESHRLLGFSDGWVLSSSIDGNLTIQSTDDTSLYENFNLKKTIATASIKGDTIAVLLTTNEMILYSMLKNKIILREKGDAPTVVNAKIVEPKFQGELVVFSTLDGKVVIINKKTKKKLRTVIVSGEDHFNNVIYYNIVNNKIIAATGYKILSLSQKEHRVRHDIRTVVDDGNNIYIATKQGEIISLTPDLQQNKRVKFPFAHFLGMIVHEDKVYALEKEGYIIELSKDLLEYDIYDVDVEDGYIFVGSDKFYVDDEYISVVSQQDEEPHDENVRKEEYYDREDKKHYFEDENEEERIREEFYD